MIYNKGLYRSMSLFDLLAIRPDFARCNADIKVFLFYIMHFIYL
jgi:hypothetical protein